MKLVILTSKGTPLSRDIAAEVSRRTVEKLAGSELLEREKEVVRQAVQDAVAEMNAEYDDYAASLARSPEWGGREPGTK